MSVLSGVQDETEVFLPLMFKLNAGLQLEILASPPFSAINQFQRKSMSLFRFFSAPGSSQTVGQAAQETN